MDQMLEDALNVYAAKDTWSADDHKELLNQLHATGDPVRKLRTLLADMESKDPDPKGAEALKIGILRYMLCRFNEALVALASATDNKDRHWFQALCYKNLCQYDKAAEEFQRAAGRGWDDTEAQLHTAELDALSGALDKAAKTLAKLENHLSGSSDFHFVRGLVSELSGDGDAAVAAYERARSLNPRHSGATFRLAYYCDLHGEEDHAIELYKHCLACPPVHANSLLNLAVLYEDHGRYDQALSCLRRILATNPNHARARLFVKDVNASKVMFYDEEQAKRIARRNAVLDIPVTDFELSVRARNCLKKMNIRTLGDLVRTTEQELLSYKNFGETSLKEIKDMLTAKNLRLGQALEESNPLAAMKPLTQHETEPDDGATGLPLSQVEFSIRARRALENLKLKSLGELAACTEAELMACKNFGQTSLNEIRQRLADYGLTLRQPL